MSTNLSLCPWVILQGSMRLYQRISLSGRMEKLWLRRAARSRQLSMRECSMKSVSRFLRLVVRVKSDSTRGVSLRLVSRRKSSSNYWSIKPNATIPPHSPGSVSALCSLAAASWPLPCSSQPLEPSRPSPPASMTPTPALFPTSQTSEK